MFPPPAWNSGTIQGGIFTSSCQLQKTEIDGSCFTPKWNSQPSLGTMLLRKCRPMWTTYRLWKKYSYELITCIYLAIFLSFVFLSTYLPIYIVYIYSYIYIWSFRCRCGQGDVVTVTCPSEFSRASGDTRFRCGHGLNGGQWWRGGQWRCLPLGKAREVLKNHWNHWKMVGFWWFNAEEWWFRGIYGEFMVIEARNMLISWEFVGLN